MLILHSNYAYQIHQSQWHQLLPSIFCTFLSLVYNDYEFRVLYQEYELKLFIKSFENIDTYANITPLQLQINLQ